MPTVHHTHHVKRKMSGATTGLNPNLMPLSPELAVERKALVERVNRAIVASCTYTSESARHTYIFGQQKKAETLLDFESALARTATRKNFKTDLSRVHADLLTIENAIAIAREFCTSPSVGTELKTILERIFAERGTLLHAANSLLAECAGSGVSVAYQHIPNWGEQWKSCCPHYNEIREVLEKANTKKKERQKSAKAGSPDTSPLSYEEATLLALTSLMRLRDTIASFNPQLEKRAIIDAVKPPTQAQIEELERKQGLRKRERKELASLRAKQNRIEQKRKRRQSASVVVSPPICREPQITEIQPPPEIIQPPLTLPQKLLQTLRNLMRRD